MLLVITMVLEMINTFRTYIRRYVLYALCVGMLCGIHPSAVYSADPYIDTFVADVTLTNEATIVVTETLAYMNVVPGETYERCLTTRHHDAASSIFKYRSRTISFDRVVVDADAVTPEVIERDGAVCASYALPQASTQVTLSYQIRGGLTYVPNAGAELFWSVDTDAFTMSVRDVRVVMRQTDISFTADRSCYHGLPSKEESCRFSNEAGALIFRGNLDRKGESIVVVQGVSSANTPRVVYESVYPQVLVWAGVVAVVLIASVFFGVGRKREVEPHEDIAYEPPALFEPIQAGMLVGRALQHPDIVGQIFLLAERGVLHIAYTPATQRVTMTRRMEHNHELSMLDVALLELIFGPEDAQTTCNCSDTKMLSHHQSRYREVVPRLTRAIKKILVHNGHIRYCALEDIPSTWWVLGLSTVGIVSGVWSWKIGVGIAMVLLGCVCVYGLGLRTSLGRRVKDQVFRFAEYLRVPQTQRFVLHNAPVMSAHHYLGYVPYSIALEAHHEWSQSFGQLSCAPSWLTTETQPTTQDIDALADVLIKTLDAWSVDKT